MKRVIMRALLGIKAKKTMIGRPETVERDETRCVGYRISTSMRDDRKSEDIPRFFHKVYDGKKLKGFREDGTRDVYCVFGEIGENGDFDYYVAEEEMTDGAYEREERVSLAKGTYVRTEILKKNHGAVSGVMGYLMKVWLRKNGYAPRKAPCCIVYGKGFHENYEKHGCVGGRYPGTPTAVLMIPVEKAG